MLVSNTFSLLTHIFSYNFYILHYLNTYILIKIKSYNKHLKNFDQCWSFKIFKLQEFAFYYKSSQKHNNFYFRFWKKTTLLIFGRSFLLYKIDYNLQTITLTLTFWISSTIKYINIHLFLFFHKCRNTFLVILFKLVVINCIR